MHSELLSPYAYFPGSHSEQAGEATPENSPGEHERHSVCPLLAYFPGWHAKQVEAPEMELWKPSMSQTFLTPPTQKEPTSQMASPWRVVSDPPME